MFVLLEVKSSKNTALSSLMLLVESLLSSIFIFYYTMNILSFDKIYFRDNLDKKKKTKLLLVGIFLFS